VERWGWCGRFFWRDRTTWFTRTMRGRIRWARSSVAAADRFAAGRVSGGFEGKYGRQAHIAVSEFVKRVLTRAACRNRRSHVYDGVPLLEPAQGERGAALANADDPQKGAPLAWNGADGCFR